jgi:hypothetical protein
MKTKTNLFSFGAGTAGFFLGALGLQAVVIFDSVHSNGNDWVNSINYLAQSFKTDATNTRLTSVILRMDGDADAYGGFFVRIYNATGANQRPNQPVATLTGSANPATAGNYEYQPTGSLDLATNTCYWVVAGVSSGLGQYAWRRELPPSIEVGSTIGNSFNSLAFGFGWSAPSTGEAFSMQVNAQPVPKPASRPLLTITPDGNGGFYIRCAGQEGTTYRLQRAAGCNDSWFGIATNTAPTSGIILFHDTSPLPGRAIYRTCH